MAILNYNLNNIGEAGNVPVFIYFNTNDSPSTVVDPGYLNKFVAQGNTITATDLALVTTQLSHSAPPVTGLFQISYSGGNWSLKPYQNVTPSGDAWLLTGNSNAAPFPANFIGTSNSVPLSIGVGGDELIVLGTDLSVSIITDTAPVLIESLSAAITTSQNIALSAAGQIQMPILKAGVEADIIYFNSSNGNLSYGAVPIGADWNLSGTNSGAGLLLGVNTTDTWSIVQDSIPFLTLSTSSLAIGANAAVLSVTVGNPSSNISIDGTSLFIPNLEANAPDGIVYYNSSTGQVSWSPASSVLAGAWLTNGENSGAGLLLGTNTANGYAFQVDSVAWLTVSSTAGVTMNTAAFSLSGTSTLLITATGMMEFGRASQSAGITVDAAGNTSLTTATGAVTLEVLTGGTSLNLITQSGIPIILDTTGNLTALASTIFLSAPAINMPSIGSATTANILYYGAGGAITYGAVAAPSGGGWTWSSVTTNTTLVAGNAYVNTNDASQITYTLPATAAFGDTYLVSGFGAGNWQIAPSGSQVVLLGASSVGSGHTLTSVSGSAVAAEIVCVVPNTTYMIYAASGSINIV